MSDRKINVLVAEDSAAAPMPLVHLLESDPRLRVVGAVSDGQQALDFIKHSKPDVIVMDIHMPNMDGLEATRRIMETVPVPIIVCSTNSNLKDVAVTFKALEVGALACVEKPGARDGRESELQTAHLLEMVRLMSEVRVVRRTSRTPGIAQGAAVAGIARTSARPIRLIGIGASTGGPPVLQAILASLPNDLPVPLLIVQHIAPGFLAGMIDWLKETTGLQVHMAAYGVLPLPGHVYLAPDHLHMGIQTDGRIVLSHSAAENHVRPAISFLFRSVAEVYGPDAVGVLLTGMGQDGAAEMKIMRQRGAITIAQDRESSAVYGMPGAAIAAGGATHVLSSNAIAGVLVALAGSGTRQLIKLKS